MVARHSRHALEPVWNRITRRPTRPFGSVFQPKPSAWFTKQSDFHQKTASKLASLDLAIYPGQAPRHMRESAIFHLLPLKSADVPQ